MVRAKTSVFNPQRRAPQSPTNWIIWPINRSPTGHARHLSSIQVGIPVELCIMVVPPLCRPAPMSTGPGGPDGTCHVYLRLLGRYLNQEQSGPGSSHRFPQPPRTEGPWGRLRTLRPVRGHPRARPPPSMGLCRGNRSSVDECFALALVEEVVVTIGGSHGGALSLFLFAGFGGWSEAFARVAPTTGVTLPRLTYGARLASFCLGA